MGSTQQTTSPSTPDHTARIAPGLFTTGEPALTPECFSTRFLTLARLEAGLDVASTLTTVQLDDRAAMDRHPIAIMSGEGAFELSASHLAALRDYLERGGFLIASAGCSSHPWASSFERVVERLRGSPGWESAALEPIEPGHELLETVYAVRSLSTRKAAQDGAISEGPIGRLFALTLEGRVCIVYSPDGLNDTDGAGGGCCCCGGSELREARWIKVNALAYTLLR